MAVLPEMEDVDVEIVEKDLGVDTYRSGGAGGQHVNRPDPAVRLTALPTCVVVVWANEHRPVQYRARATKLPCSRQADLPVRVLSAGYPFSKHDRHAPAYGLGESPKSPGPRSSCRATSTSCSTRCRSTSKPRP